MVSTAIHNVSLVIALMERANLGFTNPIVSTYMGKFNDGLPNGKGKIEYTDWGVSFEGFFVNGEIDSTTNGVLLMNHSTKKGNISERVSKDNDGICRGIGY